MIQYEGRNWLAVVLRLQGSVAPRLAPRVLLVTAVGALAAWLYARFGLHVPMVAHTLIGVALGLLLVFRTNASYDRYWEGRKLAGMLVNRTRDFVRQVAAFVPEDGAREELRRWTCAFYRLATLTLRGEKALGGLGALLTEQERAALDGVANPAPVVLGWLARRLAERARAGTLGEERLWLMDQNLTSFNDSLGGAERIVKTPIPFAYAQHIKVFVLLFCVSVPFAIVDVMGWATPFAAGVLAFGLLGIDEIGVEIEDPFGHDANDLPLDAIGDGIEEATAEILATPPPA